MSLDDDDGGDDDDDDGSGFSIILVVATPAALVDSPMGNPAFFMIERSCKPDISLRSSFPRGLD